MEEEAEDYIAELVDRSMLQVVQRDDFGRTKAFRMHDVVRELTLAISGKAKFCMILDGPQSVSDDQTRRLSIQTSNETLGLNRSISQLRSLITFDTSPFSSGFLIRLKMLRVLELENAPISNLPNEVSTLFNLHYLGLRYSKVKELPNNIQKLQSLQTLDLLCCHIKKLPHGVTQLKQLRHLFLPVTVIGYAHSPTPEEAWQCKNLQTLKYVCANKNLVQRLGDMKELRNLSLVEVEQAYCPQLCTSLTKLRNLHCLSLSSRKGLLNFEMLNSSPPPLQKLHLWGILFEGKMARFIRSCVELTHVSLMSSLLIEDSLHSLGQLPKLVELTLEYDAFDGQKLHFRSGWFLNLKKLVLGESTNLDNIVIEKGAMINLREVYMSDLMELKMFPPGIEFLTHLETLFVAGLPEELLGKLRRDNDNNEDRQRIKHIPNVTIC